MSQAAIKQLIAQGSLICPECKKTITKFDKYADIPQSVWDGAGESRVTSTGSSRVTLICGNGGCAWQERTEYWENYVV
jgi:hypothetical protein